VASSCSACWCCRCCGGGWTRPAAHRGVTLQSLAEPGYGRTLALKLALFAAVLLVCGVHGMAVGRGQARLARLAGIATLLGSVGVVLLATALVP
jgi:hypothetical protein